uniref:BCNT-C domain-containing protein n=1 Tax=Kalanchoe fedtschenkoi TaxID=63787 RepID=A0A7N0UFM0_KALFE
MDGAIISQGEATPNEKRSDEAASEVPSTPISDSNNVENERKARVEAMWQQMNKGVSFKPFKPSPVKSHSPAKKTAERTNHGWMSYLGVGPKKAENPGQSIPENEPTAVENGTSEEAKRLAAAALSAVKEATAAATAGKGKVEITEMRDFAGQDIALKKLVDADSKEASEKAKASAGPPSAVDAILEQIKKKQKLSVLDKTKMDWGEYKESKGVEEELDAYKKSSNQYLDKVSFLQRADYREFERERDARLSQQARKRPDMREDLN